ncbi:MAG: HNH endonuclease [Streptomycetaceae bacterium]|nr:HNH endonuclease [Streptomycetaceae bacterium]
MPEPPAADVGEKELADLTVAAPHSMAGYSRAKFPHWITQYGQCDTREVVLARDGQDVIQDEKCRAISGTWYSEYDGKTLTSASQVDIDHMVPLANAWRSGADSWTTAERRRFANDLVDSQLIAVSAASNRSKGDQSPDQWAPPRYAYWCTYSRAWTHIKYIYHLTITAPEKDKLTAMLDTCET